MSRDLYNNIIEVTDIRGILVVCEKSRWEEHIILHPEVKGKEEVVKNTIKEPEVIYQSAEYKERDVYFGKMEEDNKYMKVIVEMSAPNCGEVITAFVRKDISGNIDTKVIKYDKSKL